LPFSLQQLLRAAARCCALLRAAASINKMGSQIDFNRFFSKLATLGLIN
jgi:hypothetical protein